MSPLNLPASVLNDQNLEDETDVSLLEPGQSHDPVRLFATGATRDTDQGKLDYEGFFSPAVLHRRAEYMHKHRFQSDGALRASDNWQKGIPIEEYMKSAFRHFMAWWFAHRDRAVDREELEDAICALMFNCEGYLHELLKTSGDARA